MKSRSRSRKATKIPRARRRRIATRRVLAESACSRTSAISALRGAPLGEQRTHHHRLDDTHDLVAVRVVRAQLRPLVGVEPPLEQRAQDGRVDLRPVEVRGAVRDVDLLPVHRQGRVVLEQSAVEPRNRVVESHAPAGRHSGEQRPGHVLELVRRLSRLREHPAEHVVRQQPRVLGEHAEDEPVDEVRDRLGLVSPFAKGLRKLHERRRRLRCQRLPREFGPQPLRVAHRPLQRVPRRGLGEILERELVETADAVGPVGADAETDHVRDDQKRRVLQRKRVLPQLPERRIEVGVPALVLPGEVVALPDVCPSAAAVVLSRAALEAVAFASRIGVGGRGLAQHPAQVDEVLLRGGSLLEFGGPPLGDEFTRGHAVAPRFPRLRKVPIVA